jgi:PAS domain S-box-containing protein
MDTIQQLKKNSPDPLIIADNQGTVIEVNHHFEQVFGWRRQEIIGQHVTVILPVHFRDAHHLGFSRFNVTGVSKILNHPLRLKTLTKTGEEIISEHTIIAEKNAEQWIFAATLRPLPAEK